jgi:acyl carrier protein
MTPDAAMTEIADVIAGQFKVAPSAVSRGTTAFDIPGWDSLAHVYVILEIERRFNTRLPAEKVLSAATVGELVDLVLEQLGPGPT